MFRDARRIEMTPARKEALGKAPGGHKYQSGHALILSGGAGRTGAARLAARGALRIGAGLVTVGCPHSALPEVAGQLTAIMCRPLGGAPGLTEALEDKRLNSLCLGPGMGLGADTQAMVLAALAAKRATVLDADALTRFDRSPDVLFEALHDQVVLTPHEGEFSRLFRDLPLADDVEIRIESVRRAAAQSGANVLLKGPRTVIATPDGRAALHDATGSNAAPWLATAGSGDVLAGFITGLMARGISPFDATGTAVWLHAACARSFGPGLVAEDLPEELPMVFHEIDL